MTVRAVPWIERVNADTEPVGPGDEDTSSEGLVVAQEAVGVDDDLAVPGRARRERHPGDADEPRAVVEPSSSRYACATCTVETSPRLVARRRTCTRPSMTCAPVTSCRVGA